MLNQAIGSALVATAAATQPLAVDLPEVAEQVEKLARRRSALAVQDVEQHQGQFIPKENHALFRVDRVQNITHGSFEKGLPVRLRRGQLKVLVASRQKGVPRSDELGLGSREAGQVIPHGGIERSD